MCAGGTQRQGVTVEDILPSIGIKDIRTNTYVVLLINLSYIFQNELSSSHEISQIPYMTAFHGYLEK